MISYAISLILPILAAYALVAYCDRRSPGGVATFFFRICLATGIAVGLSSCTYFSWLFFVGAPGKTYHVCELTLFAAIALFGWFLTRSRQKNSPLPLGEGPGVRVVVLESQKKHHPHPQNICPHPSPLPKGEGTAMWFLTIAFVATLFLAVIGAVGAYQQAPLGDWDAWAIWNLRARTIFHADNDWRQAFSPVFRHVDYPLLAPCNNARAWSYAGHECPWTPWFLGSLMTFATVGLLSSGVCRLRSRSQGLLAGIVLLGMVPFLQRGALQYADIPLAFFILAAVLLLMLYDASERRPSGYLALSGLMAGLAAWTKNEGLLFLIVLPAARGAVVWRHAGARQALKEFFCFSAGIWPALAVIGLQKGCLAGSNDLIVGQNWEATVARLLDPARYWYVAQSLVFNALRIARPFAVLLPLCFLLLGITKKGSRGPLGVSTAVAVLTLMLAGYFLVYVTTPCDLHWHLKTSAGRLLLQLWPLCLLILFQRLATPEEVWTEQAAGLTALTERRHSATLVG